ncbi:hypothetical protein KAM467_23950 [Aeromonas caviae]|nr:hypothetical protein KAM467_23950 [Aeromonas caviae]
MVINQGGELSTVVYGTSLNNASLFGRIIIHKSNWVKLIALQQSHLQLPPRGTRTVDQNLCTRQTSSIQQCPKEQPHTTDHQHQKREIDDRYGSGQEDIEVKRRDNKKAR